MIEYFSRCDLGWNGDDDDDDWGKRKYFGDGDGGGDGDGDSDGDDDVDDWQWEQDFGDRADVRYSIILLSLFHRTRLMIYKCLLPFKYTTICNSIKYGPIL